MPHIKFMQHIEFSSPMPDSLTQSGCPVVLADIIKYAKDGCLHWVFKQVSDTGRKESHL